MMMKTNGCHVTSLGNDTLKIYQRLLFWIAGADRHVLQECTEAEKFRYECIGALICITATVASVSMFMAVSLTWQQHEETFQLAIPVAVLWGSLIFTIDRFMVSSIRGDANWWVRLSQAIPRLFIAVAIGIIISRPIEIKIFEAEILKIISNDTEIYLRTIDESIKLIDENNSHQANSEYSEQKFRLEDEVKTLNLRVEKLEEEKTSDRENFEFWNREAEAEGDGLAGSGKQGQGDRFYSKQAKAAEWKRQLQRTEREISTINDQINMHERELVQIQKSIDERKKELNNESLPTIDQLKEQKEIARNFGFLELNLALTRLSDLPQFVRPASAIDSLSSREKKTDIETIVSVTLWGITLLFISIEVLPILTKLLSPSDQYEEKIRSANIISQTTSAQQMIMVSRIYSALLETQEKASKMLLTNALDRIKEQDDGSAIDPNSLRNHLQGYFDELPGSSISREYRDRQIRAISIGEDNNSKLEDEKKRERKFKLYSRIRKIAIVIAVMAIMFAISFAYLRIVDEEAMNAISPAAALVGLFSPLLMLLIKRSDPDR